MNELITQINDAVWGYVLIAALVGCGVWFTIKTRFVQFRMVGEMLRLLTDSAVDTVGDQVKNQGTEGKRKHISSFQAFAVSVKYACGYGQPGWCGFYHCHRWTWCRVLDVDYRPYRIGYGFCRIYLTSCLSRNIRTRLSAVLRTISSMACTSDGYHYVCGADYAAVRTVEQLNPG